MRRIRIVSFSSTKSFLGLLLAFLLLPATVPAQDPASSSSSSSSSSAPPGERAADQEHVARPRAAQTDPGGTAVTLETNESLFDIAVALNACGYDADLERSSPIRTEVRDELNAALQETEAARSSRDALCKYILQHRLSDSGQNVGQYVSLALYLSPPPELVPSADETELPPQATQVVNILPLLRTFVAETQLHIIWLRHRAEYEAMILRVRDPMIQTIQGTKLYLNLPLSDYDPRRFLVLLEPMLAPSLTNARIYGSDYITVLSPDNTDGTPVRMDVIRHIYLHYVVEPMVFSRGTAMERIQPMLRGVQDAPIAFFYKSDAVALITECLIKAIEAGMYTIATPKPKKPSVKERADMDRYAADMVVYDRETAIERQKLVDTDEKQGWTMTGYFYRALQSMAKDGDGLQQEIAPMIYGMDVDGERKHAQSIAFVKDSSTDPLGGRPRPAPKQLAGMDLAEMDLAKGDVDGAADIAEKTMADPKGDHGRAQYMLARLDLMHGVPDKAMTGFQQALTLTKDPRTVSWSHIYLGRLYDSMNPPDREHAVQEYKAALASRDALPDTKTAAENGIKKPFTLPKREQMTPTDDNKFDPTGKAEKNAYKPKIQN